MLFVKDVAHRLGLSRSKVYQLVKQKRISHYRVEGKITFDERDVDEFLRECRIEKGRAAKAPPCRRLKHLKLS
jgi:excisionase family DNA binding protein